MKRMKEADLSYPILVTSKHQIIDGYHRVLKAMQQKQTTVKAYVLEPALLRKFIINRDLDYSAVHQHMSIHQLLELYARRFCL